MKRLDKFIAYYDGLADFPTAHGFITPDGGIVDMGDDDHHVINNWVPLDEAIWNYWISVHCGGCGLLWIRMREECLLNAQKSAIAETIDAFNVSQILVHSVSKTDRGLYWDSITLWKEDFDRLLDPIAYRIRMSEQEDVPA